MDKIKYVNHLGETIELRQGKIWCNYKDLKTFVQSLDNGRLVNSSQKATLLFLCLNNEAANRLIDVLDVDNIANKYGRFYINDWYIKVMYQGLPDIINEENSFIKINLTFAAEETIFTKENEYVLSPGDKIENVYKNYPRNYPSNYGADAVSSSSVENTQRLEADFILKFSAPSASVSVSIDSNLYEVEASVNEGETFVINTQDKEVYKETMQGKVNLFGAASDDSYIFNTISKGIHRVAWAGNFTLYLTVLEHRRTPPWI